jgi:hypothetical protein
MKDLSVSFVRSCARKPPGFKSQMLSRGPVSRVYRFEGTNLPGVKTTENMVTITGTSNNIGCNPDLLNS